VEKHSNPIKLKIAKVIIKITFSLKSFNFPPPGMLDDGLAATVYDVRWFKIDLVHLGIPL